MDKRVIADDFFAILSAWGVKTSAAEQTRKVRVASLEGGSFGRGFSHGRQLKAEIGELLKIWKGALAEEYKMDADVFIGRFLSSSSYKPAILKWTPELWEEIKGIAEGAEQPFETMLVFQLVDEYWVRGREAYEHCSSVGIAPGEGQAGILGQNLDVEWFRDGYQTLLKIEEGTNTTFVVTFPGFIGASGMNSRGVAVVPNTLSQLANSSTGLPVACVIRGILAQGSLDDAEKFLKKIEHASGQNYLMADRTGVKDFECSARKVVEYGKGRRHLAHTNHPLVNDDFTIQWKKILEANPGAMAEPGSSVLRLRSLTGKLTRREGPATLLGMKGMLQAKDFVDGAVCRANKGEGAFTFASTIMVLGPTLELHFASGPPDVNEYEVFRF